MINKKLPFIFYGGDYNPDQWSMEVVKKDIELLKEAKINIVTLPVFSWALLQPDENTYNFEWLDNIFELLKENNINICLATPTAAQPAWMSNKYPEMLLVDFYGMKHKHGARVNFCPNNPKYRKFSANITKKLALRYKDYANLALWHVGNEYNNYCYCDHCQEEFRKWLKNRYKTLDNLNRAWNMNFWGHTLYSWDEITAPSNLNEMWVDNDRTRTHFQGIALDYNRFMNDSILDCYLNEYNVIREITPDLKVTTNLMGFFKPLDYFKWAKHMDIISWDNYPAYGATPGTVAMSHDLMRGLKKGEPFMLMEQSPNQANWHPYNSVKRPGELRLQSYQALAHGADTIMYFQMRQSRGACEKYHGAVISHSESNKTRIFKDCKHIGEELELLGSKILDSRIESKVAIIFDWDNWWAIEFSSGPSADLYYVPTIEKYYKAFYNKNISVDFVEPTDDLSKYDIVIAPLLYMIKENTADNIKNFVNQGGTFLTTSFSGYVDENDLVKLGGYPGELRELLGIWVEELDALPPECTNSIEMTNSLGTFNSSYKCNLLYDLINLEGASSLGVYGSDFYKGKSVFTVNNYGKGQAYYIGSNPDDDFLNDLIDYFDKKHKLSLDFKAEKGVEITKRIKDNDEFIFILNHNYSKVSIDLKDSYINLLSNKKVNNILTLDQRDLAILTKVK